MLSDVVHGEELRNCIISKEFIYLSLSILNVEIKVYMLVCSLETSTFTQARRAEASHLPRISHRRLQGRRLLRVWRKVLLFDMVYRNCHLSLLQIFHLSTAQLLIC
jgi:hypothetical protein